MTICGKKNNSGQILGEAVVAMGLITLGVFSIFGFFTNSLKEVRTVTDQTIATHLAAEGLEITKNILDANTFVEDASWDAGFSDGDYEVSYNSDENKLSPYNDNDHICYNPADGSYTGGFSSSCIGNETSFRRKITVQKIGDNNNIIRVTAAVDWAGRAGRENKVVLVSNLLKWR